MCRHVLSVVPFVLSLVGCVAGQAPETMTPAAVTGFAHRVGTTYLVLYWNCAPTEAGRLHLEGIAQSPWSEIRSLEFELVGVDARDRTVSETKGKARDSLIRTNQTSPFQLDLRTLGTEVRYDLFYQHQYVPDDQMSALFAGPPAAPTRLIAQGNRFLARDVCGETRHRAH